MNRFEGRPRRFRPVARAWIFPRRFTYARLDCVAHRALPRMAGLDDRGRVEPHPGHPGNRPMSKFLTKPPAPPAGETLIIPVGVEKFTLPEPPNFTTAQALLSALSLLGLTVVSVLAILYADGWPWWAVLPFVFTTIGGGVGFVYETLLILAGRPFLLGGSAVGIFIQTVRRGNLGFVFGSMYLLYYLLSYGSASGAE